MDDKSALSPLQVMLLAMRGRLDAGDLASATNIARNAAPYMHPRATLPALKRDCSSDHLRMLHWLADDAGAKTGRLH